MVLALRLLVDVMHKLFKYYILTQASFFSTLRQLRWWLQKLISRPGLNDDCGSYSKPLNYHGWQFYAMLSFLASCYCILVKNGCEKWEMFMMGFNVGKVRALSAFAYTFSVLMKTFQPTPLSSLMQQTFGWAWNSHRKYMSKFQNKYKFKKECIIITYNTEEKETKKKDQVSCFHSILIFFA